MGEGYRNICASELPPGVGFGESIQVGSVEASFSGEGVGGRWGSTYRRLLSLKTGHVQFSRYYNTPDEVPVDTEVERNDE